MLITIYNSTGTPKAELSPNDSSTQVKEIQGDSVLTLSFTHYDHISLDVDDYVDFEGERFWLTEKYRPRQNSRKEWVYDIKLYGVESMLKRLLVIKTVDDEDDPVFTLTAPPREHVAMIVRCMNNGLGNITDWKVGQVEGTENIVIDYIGKYCDEALKEIAEKVGAEVWVEGQTVNICKCEHGEPITMGYDKGLLSIDPGTADNVKFYTRLYPIGSSRNIDRGKYGYSRLQLPGGAKYVEINADKYGRVDHYEKDAFADIYPRRTGTVSSVRSEVKTGEDGEPFMIYYFKDSTLPFDPNDYEIGGLVKRVSFQEGSELAGLGEEDNGTYYFEVNFNSSTREFEIITIWPHDDGSQLPGELLIPKAGDKYILWNIRMPDEYYTLAEVEFLAAVEKYNADHGLDISVYKAPTDHVWIEDNEVVLTIGQRVRLESDEYFPEAGYRDSRITKITRKVNLPSQMDIEISDALSRTGQEKMTDSIADVRSYAKAIGESVSLPDIIRTGDLTLPTDNNILSARRSYRDLMRKDQDDRSKGRIASDKGFDVGDFLAGVSGARIAKDKETGRTYGELDELYVRVKAYFESLTVIEREALAGEQQVTPGGGVKCTSVVAVDADGNALSDINSSSAVAYRCFFLSEQDGEKRETFIKAGDQVIAQEWNAKEGTDNKVSNRRWWRLVTAVNQDALTDDVGNHYGYIEVSKADCEVNSDIPEAGDDIVQFGNRTDSIRQTAIVISTVSGDAPSMKLFTGIGSGTTNAEHYSLNNRDIISYGYDRAKGRAYMRCYGDFYYGDKDGKTWIKYDAGEKTLEAKLKLHIESTIGDKTLDEYFQSLLPEDKPSYVEEALHQYSEIDGGLFITSFISAGYTDKDGLRHNLAGMNGIRETDKSPFLWGGGSMTDRFYNADGTLRQTPLASGYANALIRMDGSAYFGGGAHVFNQDGSGFLANGNITWDAAGVPTIGSNVVIKISESEDLNTALSNLTTHRIGVDNLFVVVENNAARTEHDLSWAAITENHSKILGIKAKYGFSSEGWVSARGLNPDASQVTPGLDWSEIEQQLTANGYATKSWVQSQHYLIPTDLNGYATEQWVLGKGYLTAVSWSDVTGKPTWIGASKPTYDFADLTSHPTTLAGYGITDTYTTQQLSQIFDGFVTLANPQTIGGKKTYTDTIVSTYASGTWLNGVSNAALTLNHSTYGAVWCAPTKDGRVSLSTYPSNDNVVYLGYIKSGSTHNGLMRSLRWDAAEGQLAVDSVKIGDCVITYENGGLRFSTGISSDGYVSARGQNPNGGGGGTAFNLMRSWPSSAPANTTTDALGANLGWELYQNKASVTQLNNACDNVQSWVASQGYLTSVTKAMVENVLTGNITSHTHSHITNSGRVNAITDRNNMADGISMVEAYAASAGYPCNYGNVIRVKGSGSGELLLGWSGVNNAVERIYYRNNRDNITTFSEWRALAFTTDIPTNYVTTNTAQTISAKKIFTGGMAFNQGITENSSMPFFLGIDSFVDGGAVHWLTASKVCAAIGAATTSALASYLPLTGGTLTGKLTISTAGGGNQLLVNNTSGGETYIWLQSAGVNKGAFTTCQTTYGTCIFNANGSKYLGITDAGIPHFQGNTLWHSGNDGSGSGLDADLLDGIHAANFNYCLDAFHFKIGGSGGSITTTQFIEKLTALGAFNYRHWTVKCTWNYANNDIITDTGLGNIQLAGAVIEVWSNGTSAYTIKITTSPTASVSGSVANAIFVYRNHGSDYAPNWKRIANTSDIPTKVSQLTNDSGYLTSSALSNYVDKTSYQQIGGVKEFTLQARMQGAALMFKHKDTDTGIYLAGTDVGGIVFCRHANYNWYSNIGRISMNGDVTFNSFIKSGGTSAQFLKADGSVDSNAYALSSSLSAYAKLDGTTAFSGSVQSLALLTTSAGIPALGLFRNGLGMKYSSGNDGGWIRFDEATTNAGWLEIATGDDGSEPIYVRQYNTSNAIVRTLTLLDGSGNTSFPGSVQFSGRMTGIQKLIGSSTIELKINDTDSTSVTFTGNTFRPFSAANGLISLGHPDVRWSAFYAVDGNFSGDVTTTKNAFIIDSLSHNWGLCMGSGGENRGIYEWTTGYDKWLLYFTNSNTILNHGNVGIGKVPSGYKLDVNGSIRANGDMGVTGELGVTGAAYFNSSVTSSNCFIRTSYGGSSWNNGYGALNVAVVNNSAQTPLIVAYRNGSASLGAVKGANRLFSMEFLNNGTQLAYQFASGNDNFNRFSMFSDGTFFASAGMWSAGYVSARGQNTTSDKRLKKKLTPFEVALHQIANAPSVAFEWQEGTKDVGSIAQYWQEVNPLLTPKGPDGYLTLQYGKTALLSVISVAKEVESVERRVERLERENKELKRKIEILERR